MVARIPVNGSCALAVNFFLQLVLKHELKAKMSDPNEDGTGQSSKMSFSTLLADGEWKFVKEDYENAIKSFTAVSDFLVSFT